MNGILLHRTIFDAVYELEYVRIYDANIGIRVNVRHLSRGEMK